MATARRRKRFQTSEVIGGCDNGELVAVYDHQVGREVCVRRMLPGGSSERFFREARIQANLDHPSIVPVYDLGFDPHGRPFAIMKRVRGTTLAELLHGTVTARRTRHELLRAFVDVCMAIEFAHTRGIVHRDIAPHNIVLGDFGEAYIVGWGLAKVIGEPIDTDLTAVGAGALGTVSYVAPEQLAGHEIDGSADVYALGCVLFELLTNAALHADRRADIELLDVERRPSARGGDVPPELDDACVLATADPRQRPTARELAARVQRYLDGDRDLLQRRRLATEHLVRARSAIASSPDYYARRVAMREAGRALALDPELSEAADLVASLMMDPPQRRSSPQLEHFDHELVVRGQARISILLSLGYLLFVPFLIGHRSITFTIAFTAIAVASLVLTRQRARGSHHILARSPTLVALRNAIQVAMVGCAFSPIVLAPALAAVTTFLLISSREYVRPHHLLTLIAAMVLAVLLPWCAETVGLVSATSTITGSDLVIHPDIAGGAGLRTAGWIVFVIGLMVTAAACARAVTGESPRYLMKRMFQI